MYEEQEFLKHEKAACQKEPSTHSYTEHPGLLGSFSWVHTLTPNCKTCAPNSILDPDFVLCNQQGHSNCSTESRP